MDSPHPSDALSSLTVSNDENSMIVPKTKRTRFLASYHHQRFPFRASIMLFLAKNPTSPEFYLKMIKICKFFFVQNPVLILQDSIYNGIEWIEKYGRFVQQLPTVRFKNLASKLWITGKFTFQVQEDGAENIISSIIPKFFRFDAYILRIENQVISLNDYVYFTSSAEGIFLKHVTVKDENGSDLSIVKLVEIASKVRSFECYSDTVLSNITSKTFGELLKIPHFHKLDDFGLGNIPEAFDLEAFYNYMKKNKKTSFILLFDHSISEPYKNRLEQIIDEVMDANYWAYMKPLLHFSGLDDGKWLELYYMTQR